MAILLAPQANTTIVCTSGASYTSNNDKIITNVLSDSDIDDLEDAGCYVLSPPPTSNQLGRLVGANFNVTSDQIINLNFSGSKFRVTKIVVINTSVPGMNTAQGGVYTAPSKATGQGILVAAAQTYAGLTNAATALELTLALPNLVLNANTNLYLSLTIAQGAAATADVYVYGEVYD